MFHMITLKQLFASVLLQNYFLTAASEPNRFDQ